MDFYNLNRHLDPLWYAQDFSAVVQLFHDYQAQLDGYDVTQSTEHFIVYGVIPFKWYCMRELGQMEEVEKEVADFIQANAGNDSIMACICNAVNAHFLFLLDLYEKYLPAPSRVIEAARCRYATESQDILTKLEAIARFNDIGQQQDKENWPALERQVSISRISDGEYLFANGSMTEFEIVDLPNDMGFVEASFEGENGQARFSLPLPTNDGICDTGSLSMTLASGTIEARIGLYQVQECLVHSPFGLKCRLEEVDMEITIANLQYHQD